MHTDLLKFKELIYDRIDLCFSEFVREKESQEYAAATFKLDEARVKFRVAKITPTKAGLFVTLWKRTAEGITSPHETKDPFDLYIISVSDKNKIGQFVFTPKVLTERRILKGPAHEGKRGFRVYPPWESDLNKQAQKTQAWQSDFFLELAESTLPDKINLSKFFNRK